MSQLPMNVSDRNVRAYNREERALIDVYKEQYITSSTPNDRSTIVNTKMFPALKVYWDNNRIKYDPDKARTDLLKWAQNCWRLSSQKRVPKSTKILQVQKSDVVARTMKDVVEAEIDVLLDPADVNNVQKRFSVRNLAVSNVIKRMTPTELKELEGRAEKMSEEGYPQEIRQQLAEKHSETRLKASAKGHWLELGMLSVTFAAFEDSTGRVVAEIHNDIVELVGVPKSGKIKSFEETYPRQAREVQHLMIEYVRNVIETSRGREITMAQENSLGTSDDGFPIIGATWNKDKLSKTEASKLYREYLSRHYKLATRNRTEQVPYGDIIKNQSKFIHNNYLPTGFVFKDPHNTGIDDIKAFFDHIYEREQTFAPADVFRFHSITTARINGSIIPSRYPDDIESVSDEVLAEPAKRQRKRPTKKPKQQQVSSSNALSTEEMTMTQINTHVPLGHNNHDQCGQNNDEASSSRVLIPTQLDGHGKHNTEPHIHLDGCEEQNTEVSSCLNIRGKHGEQNAEGSSRLNMHGEHGEQNAEGSSRLDRQPIDPLQIQDENMFQYLCDIGAFSFPPLENMDTPLSALSSGTHGTSSHSTQQLSFTEMLMGDYPLSNFNDSAGLARPNMEDSSEYPSMARSGANDNLNPISNDAAKMHVGTHSELPSTANDEWAHMAITNFDTNNGNNSNHASDKAAEVYRAPSQQPLVWCHVNMPATPVPTGTESVGRTTITAIAEGESSNSITPAHTAKKKNVHASPAQILNRVLTAMPMTPSKAQTQPKSNATFSETSAGHLHELNSKQNPPINVVNKGSSKRKANLQDGSGSTQNDRVAKKVVTSDELAKHEAERLKVAGKRVSKKRVRE
ncbi:hypothetical protein JR316_0001586 [Psilocybe cubensis]|uniref:Uncharacterized protein n=2 Tax=Psilocybe cubensis TaxID=181762 RepID=A0A8H7Y3U7_PSICU|nr:hypothetical protein JR316_0001586 [Psilocybe cubensis]KAH9484687.1 hypothetical protein JR316_0001586 [Psilocybe cubensis]